MRKKKHLDERMAVCKNLYVLESKEFYKQREKKPAFFDFEKLFSNNNPVHLEIGCGKGKYVSTLARQNPNINYIAIEKLSNVIVSAAEISKDVSNLVFWNVSAENLELFIKSGSIEKIYLNFSCPYPKNSYANRRLTNPRFLGIYQRLLKKGGCIRQKTDNVPFFDYSLECYEQCGYVTKGVNRNLHGEKNDEITTEYEEKFIKEGKPICALTAYPPENIKQTEKNMAHNFAKIMSKFEVTGSLVSCERYGEGHINETYLMIVDNQGKEVWYILQKINSNLFKDVDKLMNNIKLVTEFNRQKIIARGGNPDRESLSLVYTTDGKAYFHCEKCDAYFRMYKFITNAIAYQTVEKPEHFYQSAVAFGNFANLLAEFDATKLYEVLPDFHNTEKRFGDFEKSLAENKAGRKDLVSKEIEFVLSRKEYCGRIVNLLKSGKMPTKVTHNDTKLNNVMLDDKTGEPVAVIDLDTIMPGSICYDFGDSIRFGCNPCSEDEKDLSKVIFNIGLFEEYAKGYLSALGDGATEIEKENLAFGAILMTYECGMRFLSDYLDGDTYFRTHYEGQNLDRCRTQFKLVEDMEKCYNQMCEIIKKY